MDRRAFIRRGLAAGAGLAATRHLPALGEPDVARKLQDSVTNATHALESLLHYPASSSPIDTIVVLMMENRSFDHYLGWLADDEYFLEAGRSRYGGDFLVDGNNRASYVRADGSTAHTFHLPGTSGETNPWRGCGHPDPNHGWDGGRVQRDAGFVAAGSGNDDYALGYFLESDLPCYGPLARNGTVFDRAFSSLMASTYPNRYYLHAAHSNGDKNGSLPIADIGFDWPTITDRLLAAGVSVGNYFTDLPVTLFWGPRMLPVMRPIADFFVDAAAGLLPRVVFLDPGFTSGLRTDDHPHGDMRIAQAFVAMALKAFQASPQWNRGAFVVTYDEWGGFFDHVPPVRLADDRASLDDNEDFALSGFRLPVMISSPYARPGFVDHRVYDHASILRFLEWRFLGAPAEGPGGNGWWLTSRDRSAANIGASLSPVPINDWKLEIGAIEPAVSLPCDENYFQDVPGLVDVEDTGLTPLRDALGGLGTDGLDGGGVVVPLPEHAMADPLLLERFESFGFRLRPSATLAELTGIAGI